RPLFMDRKYEVTYSSDDMPTHYSFIVRSSLDEIAARHADAKRQLAAGQAPKPSLTERRASRAAAQAMSARQVVAALDARGAWVEPGSMRVASRKREDQPVIESATFIRNLRI